MQVPPQNASLTQRQHPRVFCAEDGCGRQLATGFPKEQDCPWCGGRSRRYEIDLHGTLTMRARLETTRRFYRRHTGWLIAQLAIVLVPVTAAIAGVSVSVLALVGIPLGLGLGLGLLGIFLVPPGGTGSRNAARRWTECQQELRAGESAP